MIVQELTFWLLFFLFNSLVFIVHTVMYYEHKLWVPFRNIFTDPDKDFFHDFSADFYRICLDLSILMLLARWLQWGDPELIIIAAYYGFVVLYNGYHYAFDKIYQVLPVLGNDLRLMKNVAAILWAESKGKFLLGSIIFLAAIIGLSTGMHRFLSYASGLPVNNGFYIISGVFGLYVIIGIVRNGIYTRKLDNRSRVLVMFLRIGANIQSSIRLRKRKAGWSKINADEITLKLVKKPNIYFLFVESYGSVLLQEERLREGFLAHFHKKHAALKAQQWHCTSNLSKSISLVGPSWFAYTTALLGLKITNNFEYEYFLNQTRDHGIKTIPGLFRTAGYNVVNVNDSQMKAGINVPFQQMEDLFGINHWLLKDDFKYSGKTYGFGDNAPDQFILNFTLDHIKKHQIDPCFLFYITKNSHTPFISPKSITDDWRSLSDGKEELIGGQFLRQPKYEDYLSAIKYQWDMLEALILDHGTDDDVFVLYGDHQPHALGKLEKHGKNTLVHVISKNQSFLDGFSEYGFKDDIDQFDRPIKHEAFHTAFLREMIRTYGEPGAALPKYKDHGIQF